MPATAKKKAKKFLHYLATKIKDQTQNTTVPNFKKSFKRAVAALPDGDLKAQLESDIQTYIKKLKEICLTGVSVDPPKTVAYSGEDSSNVDLEPGFVVAVPEGGYPYNLYAHKGSKINPVSKLSSDGDLQAIAKLLLQQTVSKSSDGRIDDLLSKIMGCDIDSLDHEETLQALQHLLLCHHTDSATLEKLLLIILRKVTGVTESVVQKKKMKRIRKLTSNLYHILQVIHMRGQQDSQAVTYWNIMSSLISIYIDLEVIAGRSADEVTQSSTAEQIVWRATFFLNDTQEHMLNLVAQLSCMERENKALLTPLIRKTLLTKPISTSNEEYTKYMCTAKRAIQAFGSEDTEDILKAALSVSAPASYLDWLIAEDPDILDEVPITAGFEGPHITRFIINEADQEFVEGLLNVITPQDEAQDEDAQLELETSTAEASPAKAKPPKDAGNDLPGFFIDSKGDETTKSTLKVLDIVDETEAALESVVHGDDVELISSSDEGEQSGSESGDVVSDQESSSVLDLDEPSTEKEPDEIVLSDSVDSGEKEQSKNDTISNRNVEKETSDVSNELFFIDRGSSKASSNADVVVNLATPPSSPKEKVQSPTKDSVSPKKANQKTNEIEGRSPEKNVVSNKEKLNVEPETIVLSDNDDVDKVVEKEQSASSQEELVIIDEEMEQETNLENMNQTNEKLNESSKQESPSVKRTRRSMVGKSDEKVTDSSVQRNRRSLAGEKTIDSPAKRTKHTPTPKIQSPSKQDKHGIFDFHSDGEFEAPKMRRAILKSSSDNSDSGSPRSLTSKFKASQSYTEKKTKSSGKGDRRRTMSDMDTLGDIFVTGVVTRRRSASVCSDVSEQGESGPQFTSIKSQQEEEVNKKTDLQSSPKSKSSRRRSMPILPSAEGAVSSPRKAMSRVDLLRAEVGASPRRSRRSGALLQVDVPETVQEDEGSGDESVRRSTRIRRSSVQSDNEEATPSKKKMPDQKSSPKPSTPGGVSSDKKSSPSKRRRSLRQSTGGTPR